MSQHDEWVEIGARAETKVCTKCGIQQPLTSYSMNRGTQHPHCKDCRSIYRKQLYQRNKEAESEAWRKWYFGENGREKSRKRQNASRARHGQKVYDVEARRAAWMVRNARRKGLLTKGPCEICGDSNTQGHHDDYNFPLSVRWLCAPHHNEWHKHNKPIRKRPIRAGEEKE